MLLNLLLLLPLMYWYLIIALCQENYETCHISLYPFCYLDDFYKVFNS